MRCFKVLFLSTLFFLSFFVKAKEGEVKKILETLEREKISATYGGKAAHKLRCFLMKEEKSFEDCANEKAVETILSAYQFINETRRSGLKASIYKNDSLWILASLYEKKVRVRSQVRKKATSETLLALLGFFQKKNPKSLFELKNSLLSTMRNRMLTQNNFSCLKTKKNLSVYVELLKSTLSEEDEYAQRISSFLINFFIYLVNKEKMADPLVKAGLTRALAAAHTHSAQAIRNRTKILLEDLQVCTSSSVSEKDQRETDWHRFWANLAVGFGLKEKRPRTVQIKLDSFERAEQVFRKGKR